MLLKSDGSDGNAVSQGSQKPLRWLIARDAFALAQEPTAQALQNSINKLVAVIGQPTEVKVTEGLSVGQLEEFFEIFRICQVKTWVLRNSMNLKKLYTLDRSFDSCKTYYLLFS